MNSVVLLSTPTSGTGSLWRLVSAIASARGYSCEEVADRYFASGNIEEMRSWVPEPNGWAYLYNTPQFVNAKLADPGIRLIVNFRDPRDMACNQFHWVFQHPDPSLSEDELQRYRSDVRTMGIDQYVRHVDNNALFRQLFELKDRIGRHSHDPNTLVVSYAQLCLDFDSVTDRICDFLGVNRSDVPVELIERERVDNIAGNPHWIGNVWSGADLCPGRHRRELSAETIETLDDRYRDTLAFLRGIEKFEFRGLLSTQLERDEESRVVHGSDGHLFLRGDANDTPAQIEGRMALSFNDQASIACAHLSRHAFCDAIGARYAWIIPPSKEVVLRDRLPNPERFEAHGPRPVTSFLKGVGSRMFKPFYSPELLSGLSSPAFPRDDTHWNHAGAIAYLSAFLDGSWPDVHRRFMSLDFRRFRATQMGDLGLKIYRDAEEIEIVTPCNRSSRMVYTNGLDNEGCVRHFINEDCGSGAKLLMLHDSFGMWLFDVVPEIFDEVLFVHGTVFDFEFVSKFRPSHVICLQTERFLPRVPTNGASLEEFISSQERRKASDASFSSYWSGRAG